MKTVATIEARMTSSRLPGKVLMSAGGKPLLQILIERLRRASRIDAIVVATTVNETDDPIATLARKCGVGIHRGSEEDVLQRVCGALREAYADVCVEITGDCPLIDPKIVDEAVDAFFATRSQHPYVSNSDPQRSVPAGLDVQVFETSALYELDRLTTDALDREHVSYGFYRHEAGNRWKPRFLKHALSKGGEDVLVTLDYREDYELIKQIYESLSPSQPDFGAREIIEWVRKHPKAYEPCQRVRQITAV